ncbi:MAG TPA: hypothetical protein VF331_11600, partial [Polyangiales bacterium]
TRDYQLDDLVLTGRVAFLRAARGSTEALSQHASVTAKWAATYQEYLLGSPSSTAREALLQVDREQKRKKR